MQVLAAPRLQQLQDVDGASLGADKQPARVGGALQLVRREQQLGHAGDLRRKAAPAVTPRPPGAPPAALPSVPCPPS